MVLTLLKLLKVTGPSLTDFNRYYPLNGIKNTFAEIYYLIQEQLIRLYGSFKLFPFLLLKELKIFNLLHSFCLLIKLGSR